MERGRSNSFSSILLQHHPRRKERTLALRQTSGKAPQIWDAKTDPRERESLAIATKGRVCGRREWAHFKTVQSYVNIPTTTRNTKVGVTLVFRQRTTTVIVSVVYFVYYILLYIDQAVLSVRGKFYYCTYNISTSASTRADRSAGFRNASKVTRIS